MLRKINRQLSILDFRFSLIWLLVIALLIYSRFVNLGWGLPYPMHPDERNMANAIQSMNCEISSFKFQLSNCFNPHFFAYGQLPLYLAYLGIWIFRVIWGIGTGIGITFNEAVLSLRMISAAASVLNAFIILKIILFFVDFKKINRLIEAFLIIIFSPFAIQFAHFGTTESLLMLFYSLIIYFSLKTLNSKILSFKYLILASLFSGLAVATKISSAIFMAVPLMVIISKFKVQINKLNLNIKLLGFIIGFALSTLIIAVVFSPQNLLNWKEFVNSIKYESDVALGNYIVFYTRQFVGSIPIWFQLTKIFPYAIGWLLWGLGGLGLLGLEWKDKRVNLLRNAFLIYFIPNAFLFAKWTRFMAPVFPIVIIFAILLLNKIKLNNFIKILIIFISILSGINYLKIYNNPDTRVQATAWINKNIPNNSFILSETANVVDLPLEIQDGKYLEVNSFNFYDLDIDSQLQEELKNSINKADYIFVPSRRIFKNLNDDFPLLKKYYSDLFSGKLGFKKIAEFSSGLNDENAEETWSVFDHPVIRIYKKISNLKSQISKPGNSF